MTYFEHQMSRAHGRALDEALERMELNEKPRPFPFRFVRGWTVFNRYSREAQGLPVQRKR